MCICLMSDKEDCEEHDLEKEDRECDYAQRYRDIKSENERPY